MSREQFGMLNAFGYGLASKDPAHVANLWFIGASFYFLELTLDEESSGAWCFSPKLWDSENSRLAPFRTQVPQSAGMILLYIPSFMLRVTAANVIQIVEREFLPREMKARCLDEPYNLHANAYAGQQRLILSAQYPPAMQ